MWPIPKKCSYHLARNATCLVSFELHLHKATDILLDTMEVQKHNYERDGPNGIASEQAGGGHCVAGG
jgi:hypothetical protein